MVFLFNFKYGISDYSVDFLTLFSVRILPLDISQALISETFQVVANLKRKT